MAITICPKCFKEIEPADEFIHTPRGSYGSLVKCSGCGYRGLPVEVSEKDLEKLKESRK